MTVCEGQRLGPDTVLVAWSDSAITAFLTQITTGMATMHAGLRTPAFVRPSDLVHLPAACSRYP